MAERFVRTIEESCLERMIFSSDASLRKTIAEFVTHYYLEPNHQGLGNRLIVPIGRQVKPQKLFSDASGWAECSTTTTVKRRD